MLRVISSSLAIHSRCLQAMLKNAVRLCEAKFGNIYRWDGDALHLVATQNAPSLSPRHARRSPFGQVRNPYRAHDCEQNGGLTSLICVRSMPTLTAIRGSSQALNSAAYGRF